MKIPLDNYLLKLDHKKHIRKGSDNIRIYKIGTIIEGIHSELKKYKHYKQLGEELFSKDLFLYWKLERHGIAIQDLYKICKYWKRVCNKTEKEFNDLWDNIYKDAFYFGNTINKTVKLPKQLDKNLAYLLGVILGDGHLANPNRAYDKKTSYNSELRITDGNRETFLQLRQIFKELFDYEPSIYSEKSKTNKEFYRFVIRVKAIHRFLVEICELPTGKKFDKIKIPRIIKESNLELQKWFITGFFDADGCYRISKEGYSQIFITQSYPKILYEIKEISKKLGIIWTGPYVYRYKYRNCNIKIYNKENIVRFLKVFKSINPIKQKQSELLWKKIISQSTSQSRWMETGDGAEKIKETHLKDTEKAPKH